MTLVDGKATLFDALWLALIAGCGFFLLGYSSVLLSGPAPTVSLIWPASAFAFCLLLRFSRSRAQDAIILAAIFLAQFCLTAVTGRSLMLGLGYSVIAVVELAASLIGARRFTGRRFRNLHATLKFAFAAVIMPCALGGLIAAGFMAAMGDASWEIDGLRWFSTNFLGFCMVLPFGLTLSARQIAKLNLRRRWLEAVMVFSGLALVSLFALRGLPHPMPFIILPAALVATVRFRLLGAGAAMLTVLLAVLFSTSSIYTPDEFVFRVQTMQVFLAVTSLVCARAAMVLNERDLHLAIIEGKRRRAVRTSRFKSQLLSHVSQEARGPLSAILGISGVLESGRLTPDRAQEFAHIVAHNGELLQRLYGDLLDLARAETGGLTVVPERVAVGQTLRICVGALRLDAALGGKPVLLGEIDEELTVHADPQRLAQIINNLIANSFKYGDNHSPIRVRASRLGDGFGRIEILNAGPGIALRERGALFQPFGHENRGRQVPGAGLGLSLAKLLAEKQGGRIDFESIPGRQTRFWIDLPLAA